MSDSQVSFATLGNAIGFITKLSGSVTVQSIDGQERVVKIGDPIFFGETVITGANGSAAIAFIDGTEVVIGNDAVVEITDEVYNSGDNADLVADSSADVDALQEAILAGDDPTLIQDAPAAGEAQGFEQQRVDVDIDRNDNSALPTFGNDTSSVLPTYGYDTDNGSGGQTGQNQYSAPSSSNRASSETTSTTSSETTSTTASPVAAVAGTVTVNSITSDDMINATEATSTITVSGTATGGDIAQGDQVVLVINGTTYTTTVSATGTWSVGVAGSDLAADTEFDVVVTSSNSSGDTVESIGTSTHTVDQSALLVNLDIDPITEDSTINAAESNATVTITGTVTGDAFESGVVTLVINGVSYETQVESDGTWSVDVAGSDLSADSDRIVEASVVVSNNIGQQGTTDTTESYLVKTSSRASISVNSITSDDIINAEESESNVTVSGRVGFDASAGDVVSMTINGTLYTAVVLANKTWSVEVAGSDLAQDTSFQASVTGQDSAGNSYSATTTSTHTVDLAATAGTVTVNAITSDDVINASEAAGTVSVTGTATGGDIAEGDTVTLVINGKTYTTAVDENGEWSVDVAGSDLAADTAFDAVVTSSDAAGNTVDTTGSSTHTVDLAATAGTVTVNAITSDDVINASEAAGTVSVTGTATGGDIAEGDTVTLVINGKTYTTAVDENGEWSVDVAGSDLAADTAFDAVVTSSDAAGNTVDTTGSSTHTVDLAATAGTVTVNAITSDDVINASEAAGTVSVTGTATGGDIAEGDTVTLVINGKTYTTAVDENGEWSVDVAGSDLAADTAFDAVVTSSDAAGNTVDTTGSSTHTVDLAATAGTVTVNAITSDDVINASEAAGTVSVTGTATGGDIAEGDTVTLVINGKTYTTAVDENGEWSVDVAGSDLAADTAFDAVVTSSDAAGNTVDTTGSSTHTVDLAATAGTVTVNAITSDDVINASEAAGTVSVTGTATGGDIAEGDTVTLVINGKTYTTAVDENGEWSVDVAGSDLAADTAFDAVVTSSDAAGNTVDTTGSSTHTVDLAATAGTVTVNAITSDDVINASEAAGTVSVTGTATGGDIAEGDTVTLVINGKTYTTAVDENGEWSVDVAGSDLAADTASRCGRDVF
ncbi:retention module-containing protein [Marinomonas rhodophyticola]|uniref:Retention module-containing protein n=1 Tax=Marinomonas rhodophyticola TaxID=2992803 RepID=A0ABT3KHR4_9GAMM|nr:retention module-containing protein [Marinomonas sp. KJ51-3]MCW4630050.1 retention module-containing protein [Marinomonas sp. KJ51-3]